MGAATGEARHTNSGGQRTPSGAVEKGCDFYWGDIPNPTSGPEVMTAIWDSGTSLGSAHDECSSQFRVLGEREVSAPCGGDDLETHVVGSGVIVLADAIADRGRITPGDYRIDETVASAAFNVLVTEAERAQVLRVVGESEVQTGVLSSQRPSGHRIGFEYDRYLGSEERRWAEDGPRMGRVLHGHEVGMSSGGTLGRQLKHAATECGQDAPFHGDRGLERVERVEVGDHVGVGAGVAAHQGSVAGADPQQKASREPGLEIGNGCPDIGGRSRPHADDPARHRDPRRRCQELTERGGKPRVEAARRPERIEPQGLEFGGDINRGLGRYVPGAAPPRANSAHVHMATVMAGGLSVQAGRRAQDR
jgi:hypothetical protein